MKNQIKMKTKFFLSAITIAVLLFISQNFYGQSNDGGSSPSTQPKSGVTRTTGETIYYVCPMHPEITSNKPDSCSKCGMNLEQKKEKLLKPEQQKDSVYYTCSMHPEVKETKSGKCPKCGMELIKKSINDKPSKKHKKMMHCMNDMDMSEPTEKHPMRIIWVVMGVMMVGVMTTMIVVAAGR